MKKFDFGKSFWENLNKHEIQSEKIGQFNDAKNNVPYFP